MDLFIPPFSYDAQKHTITINNSTQSTNASRWKWKKVYVVVDQGKVSFVSLNFFQRGLRTLGAYKHTYLKNVQNALKQLQVPFEVNKEQNASIREQLLMHFAHLSKPQEPLPTPSTPPSQEEFIDLPFSMYEELTTTSSLELRPYAMVRFAEICEKNNDHEKAMEWYEKADQLIRSKCNCPWIRSGEVYYRIGCAYREAAKTEQDSKKADDNRSKAADAFDSASLRNNRHAFLEYFQLAYDDPQHTSLVPCAFRQELGYYGELAQNKESLQFFLDKQDGSKAENVVKCLFLLQEIWKESGDEVIRQMMQTFHKKEASQHATGLIPPIETWENLTPQSLTEYTLLCNNTDSLHFVGLIYERAEQYDDAYTAYQRATTVRGSYAISPWATIPGCLFDVHRKGES